MYFHEATYDLDILMRQNLHIHTHFSRCAKPEMLVPDIIDRAERAGLEIIALTDHYNDDIDDEECLRRNNVLRAETAKIEKKVKVLFGNELSAYGIGKSIEGEKLRSSLDYRLFSCNHYHLQYWEQPEDKSSRGYAKHAVAVLTELLTSGKPDCIAHPMIDGYIRAIEQKCTVTAAITDNELGDLLTLGAQNKVAFELNVGAVCDDPIFAKRMWNIGREIGTYFNFGSDTHNLAGIDTAQFSERIKAALY